MFNWLKGRVSNAVYFILQIVALVITVVPFLILKLPTMVVLIAFFVFSIPLVGMIANIAIYALAFTEAIKQPLDTTVIVFYVVLAVNVIQLVLSFIAAQSDRSKEENKAL